ncbi:hypothetical protein EVAR_84869_1 [Eumeta japonica]|uniref:Uncharacterized protein n=1 Tax=Eumeta variegata TaxID=151549 RepID=A0A4C1Z920_EUMVA|nr:hypothetical protein EVAR_84869_1 [Eumeta japonica]
MELEDGHRNSVIKRRNPSSLGSFDSYEYFDNRKASDDGAGSSDDGAEGGHRNSVIKRRNPIEFGLV